MSELSFREAVASDVDRCFEIESMAYAGEEAATKEKILLRIQTYPTGFIVLENQDEIIGFINCGTTDNVVLSDEEFKALVGHDPAGKYVVVMSVVVDPKYQRKGMASRLLTEFIKRMKALHKTEIYLICQSEFIPLYAKHDFVLLGESDSSHGGLKWHEMSLSL